jgi:hypothetical protein
VPGPLSAGGLRGGLAAAAFSLLLLLAALPAAASAAVPPDCTGPVANPQPGTSAWYQRELDNTYCGEQRFYDTSSNPAFGTAWAELTARNGGIVNEDPFRDPLLWNQIRFRYRQISFRNRSGQTLPGYLFEPCDAACHDRPPGCGPTTRPIPGS